MSRPSGVTFFEEKWHDAAGQQHDKVSFADVPVDAAHDNAISTKEFIEASRSLMTLFGHLGSIAFAPVSKDIGGNIDKIEQRYAETETTPSTPLHLSTTLQSLVTAELKEKKHKASEGLLWLVRGLDFTAAALRRNLDAGGGEELSASFRDGYARTLAKHHSFLIKPIFNAAMSATPRRADFYDKLAGIDARWTPADDGERALKKELLDRMTTELRPWLAALEERVRILNEFMARKENKW